MTLIGAGGIGGPTAIALAKMGVRTLYIYDHDTVEDINIPTQFHKLSDIGNNKAKALNATLTEYSDEILSDGWKGLKYPNDLVYPSSIIISAVDSLTARKKIWEWIISSNAVKFKWYLDARMAAEQFQLFTVKSDDILWYNDMLHAMNEDDIPELPCTAKATIYCGMVAGGMIANQVKRIVMSEPVQTVQIFDIADLILLTPGRTIE
jgi:molybdopterin/thiamine biosynthesis adenylyltransferase